MQFKRYQALFKDTAIIFGLCLVIVALMGEIIYTLVFAVVLTVLNYFAISALAKATDNGSLNDYISMNDNQVELHCKDKTVVIQWNDVISYKRIRPIRGAMLQEIIIDKYGTRISFATSNRQDKKIFALRPELEEVFQECARDE